jgi:transcriptional regulator with XRE-family HTH domain
MEKRPEKPASEGIRRFIETGSSNQMEGKRKLIEELRKKENLTQEQIGKAIGVSAPTVGMWIRSLKALAELYPEVDGIISEFKKAKDPGIAILEFIEKNPGAKQGLIADSIKSTPGAVALNLLKLRELGDFDPDVRKIVEKHDLAVEFRDLKPILLIIGQKPGLHEAGIRQELRAKNIDVKFKTLVNAMKRVEEYAAKKPELRLGEILMQKEIEELEGMGSKSHEQKISEIVKTHIRELEKKMKEELEEN